MKIALDKIIPPGEFGTDRSLNELKRLLFLAMTRLG
jgi:hypothetical protein